METYEVIYVSWYLHDRWGSNEESGSSLHLNLEDFEKFHQNYLSKYTKNDLENNSHIPRKPINARISKDLYQRMLDTEFGLNLSDEEDILLIKEGKIVFVPT